MMSLLRNLCPYLVVSCSISVVSLVSYLITPLIGYHAVGFIFLFFITVISPFMRIGLTVLAALLSALVWNFFFMPPQYTFIIHAPEDLMMFIAYFFVALTIGLLTTKLKRKRVQYEKSRTQVRLFSESEKFHKTLLNCIAHEFKTPLTAIVGAATTLQTQGEQKKRNATTDKMLLEEIVASSGRLNNLFENLLDMERIESGATHLNHEWFSLVELVRHVITLQEKMLSEHTIDIKMEDEPLYYCGDFSLLEHALSNVILNSAHYSPKRSKITITVSKNSDSLNIAVADEGKGIPGQYKANLFEKFYRIPGTPSGGLGLGLSIAKNLVELHRGSIKITDNSSGGSTFTLALPYLQPPAQILGSEL